MLTDVAEELGLEIERSGHARNPLAVSIVLCCCLSCSSSGSGEQEE